MSTIGSLQSSAISASVISTVTSTKQEDEEKEQSYSSSLFNTEDTVNISAEGAELSQSVAATGSSDSADMETSTSAETTAQSGSVSGGSGSGSATDTATEQQISQLEAQIAALQEEIANLKGKAQGDPSTAQLLAAKQAELMSLEGSLQELLLEEA